MRFQKLFECCGWWNSYRVLRGTGNSRPAALYRGGMGDLLAVTPWPSHHHHMGYLEELNRFTSVFLHEVCAQDANTLV